jgi:hypothetical protein
MSDTELRALTTEVKEADGQGGGFGAAFAEDYSAEAGLQEAAGKSA